jgi:hypothetical protein
MPLLCLATACDVGATGSASAGPTKRRTPHCTGGARHFLRHVYLPLVLGLAEAEVEFVVEEPRDFGPDVFLRQFIR